MDESGGSGQPRSGTDEPAEHHAGPASPAAPAPTPAELQVYCAGQLARFKLPTVELVRELPHSAIGKVRKREITS